MGSLPWREKSGLLGCRRGWRGIGRVALLAVIVYGASYVGFRTTRVICIDTVGHIGAGGAVVERYYSMRVEYCPGSSIANQMTRIVWLPAMYVEIALNRLVGHVTIRPLL